MECPPESLSLNTLTSDELSPPHVPYASRSAKPNTSPEQSVQLELAVYVCVSHSLHTPQASVTHIRACSALSDVSARSTQPTRSESGTAMCCSAARSNCHAWKQRRLAGETGRVAATRSDQVGDMPSGAALPCPQKAR